MNVFGKPYSSQMEVSSADKKEGLVKMFGNLQRPTPDHICSPDGFWLLPEVTNEEIAAQREAKYAEYGADELLVDIQASSLLGQDTSEKLDKWKGIQARVREELPYLTTPPNLVTGHYQAVKPASI